MKIKQIDISPIQNTNGKISVKATLSKRLFFEIIRTNTLCFSHTRNITLIEDNCIFIQEGYLDLFQSQFFKHACLSIEQFYFSMLNLGYPKNIAESVLGNNTGIECRLSGDRASWDSFLCSAIANEDLDLKLKFAQALPFKIEIKRRRRKCRKVPFQNKI